MLDEISLVMFIAESLFPNTTIFPFVLLVIALENLACSFKSQLQNWNPHARNSGVGGITRPHVLIRDFGIC